MRLRSSFLAIVLTLATGCGAATELFPGGADQGDASDDAGDESPPQPGPQPPTPGPEPFDAQPPTPVPPPQPIPDAMPPEPIDATPGPDCLVDLEPCIDGSQCCSGLCTNGACSGNQPFDAGPPPPLPTDAGPGPIGCASTGGNACDYCMAMNCCSQLLACEGDSTCAQGLACFDQCYTPGNGYNCESKCGQAYPSYPGYQLTNCAVSSCGYACQ